MPIVAALPAIASVAGIGSSIYGAVNNANATGKAAQTQADAAKQAAANYAPWLGAGQSALGAQMQLLGLGGGAGGIGGQPNYAAYVQNNPDLLAAYQSQQGLARGKSMEQFGQEHWQGYGQGESRPYTPFGTAGANGQGTAATGQQSAIDALKQSPYYQSLYHNGEQATLANAAATGGLRGGNAERSLYNVGTDTLAQAFQQQFNNLGSLSSLGENAAAGVGNGQIQAGAAQAGGILGSANANNQLASTIAGIPSLFGNSQVLSALGLGGGVKSTSTSNALGNLYNIPAQASSPLALNTNIPVPVF